MLFILPLIITSLSTADPLPKGRVLSLALTSPPSVELPDTASIVSDNPSNSSDVTQTSSPSIAVVEASSELTAVEDTSSPTSSPSIAFVGDASPEPTAGPKDSASPSIAVGDASSEPTGAPTGVPTEAPTIPPTAEGQTSQPSTSPSDHANPNPKKKKKKKKKKSTDEKVSRSPVIGISIVLSLMLMSIFVGRLGGGSYRRRQSRSDGFVRMRSGGDVGGGEGYFEEEESGVLGGLREEDFVDTISDEEMEEGVQMVEMGGRFL